MTDTDFMARAFQLAERGRGRTTPNPLVGAVVVSADGVVVGQGAHERAGEPHAEIHALEAAGERTRGATLYCTLEPCCHHGRTGPCTERIIASGIARVVVAIEDPFPLVAGRGIEHLRAHGVRVDVGLGRARAARQNAPFFTTVREGRPFVILKAATSLDGRLTAAEGTRTVLTSEPANRRAHAVRAWVDAIAVGSGTVLVDDPFLTARGSQRERPLTRVIFDRRLRTPPGARLLSTAAHGPVIILSSPGAVRERASHAAALRRAGAMVVPVEGPTLRDALTALRPFSINSLLLEGGAAVQNAAWDESVVDEVHLYIAPVVLGPTGVPLLPGRSFSIPALFDTEVTVDGPDTCIHGYVHRAG